MSEPVWLTADLVIALHAEQLRIFGGPEGIRDRAMLDSAIGRPRHKWSYGETDLAVLAAACGYGVARNHPFVDGNKRAALLSVVTFLGLNDIDFVADNAEAVVIIQGLAAGEIGEEGLARWIRDNWPSPAQGRAEPGRKQSKSSRGQTRASGVRPGKSISPGGSKSKPKKA